MFIETYGCQMNVNDTEIAWSILKDAGYQKSMNLFEVSWVSELKFIMMKFLSLRDKMFQFIDLNLEDPLPTILW